jgi:NAD(P)-dependent dehydrogenase (short-subunit alcohol dehydrogenase family)
MNEKIVLITGATSGIGLATASALAKLGATVVMHGRSPQKLEQAKLEIQTQQPDAKLETLVADLASLADVRKLASDFQGKHAKLDVLIHNAGVAPKDRELSHDGFELQFAVNHLAPFLLTYLLLENLKAGVPARVVNVASNAQSLGKMDFENLQAEKGYNLLGAYARNKLAMTMMTVEWAARLERHNITVNVLNPGWTQTAMSDGMERASGILGFMNRSAKYLPFLRAAPQQGAATSVYLASSAKVAGITGQYFTEHQKVGKMNPLALKLKLREKLWQISENLAGIS